MHYFTGRRLSGLRRRLFRHSLGSILIGLCLGAAGIAVLFLLVDLTPQPRSDNRVVRSGQSLGPAPVCADLPDPPAVVSITAEGPRLAFDSDCYYAPANAPLKIVFSNQITSKEGQVGVPANVSIYPSQAAAVEVLDEGAGLNVGPDQLAAGLFHGDWISSPGTVTYEVPALPAGVYYLQSDPNADFVYATLVVEPFGS